MYLHARCGRFYKNEYRDDVTTHDQFIGGYVGILDRLAVARLSATSRTTLRQNIIAIPMMLVSGALLVWGIYAFIMHFAPQVIDASSYQGHKTWENGATIAGMVVGAGVAVLCTWELVSYDSTGHTPLSRLCDWIIIRPRIVSRRVNVGSSRALRTLATGTCSESSSGSSRTTVIRWLRGHDATMRTIQRFVGDRWTRRVEALIESRPSDPTDDDRQQLEALKSQLDARAAAVVAVIDAQHANRVAAAYTQSSAADAKWRTKVAQLTRDH